MRSGNTAEDATMLLIQAALRKFNAEKVPTSLGTSASLLPQTLLTMPSPKPAVHVKVIIFKIACSKQQTPWSTHHQEP